MDSGQTESSAEPPPLEVMAALSSLLIHDLANHLSIISGNAQLAQMLSHEPERVEAALAAVVQASVMAGDLVKRCGDLRRGLQSPFPPGDVGEAVDLTRRALLAWPRWTVDAADGTGRTLVPAHWIAVGVREIVRETGVGSGRVRFGFRVLDAASARSRRLPAVAGPTVLEVSATNDERKEFPFASLKNGRSNLLFLAAHELVVNSGGWFEFDPTTDRTERSVGVRFYVPMLPAG